MQRSLDRISIEMNRDRRTTEHYTSVTVSSVVLASIVFDSSFIELNFISDAENLLEAIDPDSGYQIRDAKLIVGVFRKEGATDIISKEPISLDEAFKLLREFKTRSLYSATVEEIAYAHAGTINVLVRHRGVQMNQTHFLDSDLWPDGEYFSDLLNSAQTVHNK